MYGSFAYFYHKNQPTVGQYTSPVQPWVSWDIPQFVATKGSLLWNSNYITPPRKANMTMENPPLEDGLPIENVDFTMCVP